MPWIQLDDQFPDHPKIVQAGPLAAWLYVCGLAYCGRLLTDGYIPAGQVRKLADLDNAHELAQVLVDAGLWIAADGGYMVHDYLDYQRSKAEVEDLKAQRRRAGQAGGLAKAKQAASKPASKSLANGKQNPATSHTDTDTDTEKERELIHAAGAANAPEPPERDLLFEAVAEAWTGEAYADLKLTKSQRGNINAAVAQLREINADPADVPREWQRLNTRYDNPTPAALAKHWGTNGSRSSEIASRAPPNMSKWRDYANSQRTAEELSRALAAADQPIHAREPDPS